MGDPIASAVVRTITAILGSTLVQDHITLHWDFKDDLKSLQSTFSTLQSVLEDAEVQQRKSLALQNWLQKMQDAAYNVQEILDDIRQKADSQRGKSFLFLRKPLLFRFKMAYKMKKVRSKLDAIAKERHAFHLSEGGGGNRFGVMPESRNTCSVMIEPEPYGRQEDMENIMDKLLDDARGQDDLSVYAIWGMGGIGKTTLAQMVYNEERSKKHFDLRIWVCVSDDFTVERLVGAIIQKIDGCRSNLSELDPLQCHLRKKLMEKRNFLLVLDDVWNENEEKWDTLKSILRCGLKGSVLLVTTRNEKVASMMATINPQRIGFLNEEDSWSLFQRRAFLTGAVKDDLVSIGKRIVKKCGSVPLAVKALSSLMRSKTGESEWLAIEKNEMWPLLNDENDISPILKLSYYNLQPHMRQCFAYCCIFPKDHEMEEDQLIQLWMANDYIPCDDHGDLLLSGRSIFRELVWRCFFQDVKNNYVGKTTCKMHDLMHDLAASVMRNETHIEYGKGFNIPKPPRHIAIERIDLERIELPKVDSLRSIRVALNNERVYDKDVSSFLSKQKYLRALHFPYWGEPKFLNMICKLRHLKYLTVSCYGITRLPESLTLLTNLQTLELTSTFKLVELPKKLKVMKKLWILDIDDIRSLLCMPPELGELTCLRTLGFFIIGHDASQHINQLRELNNLEGGLVIKGLENVRNLGDANSSSLVTKRNLTSLSLVWMEDHNNKPPQHFDEVLEGLKPHCNIKEIFIKCYHGSKLPNWMGNLLCLISLKIDGCPKLDKIPCLPCLKELRLYDCNATLLTSIRNLTSLQSCVLRCLDEVDILPNELLQGSDALLYLQISGSCIRSLSNMFDYLPSLKHLAFAWCRNLAVFPEGLGSLRSLETLKFISCESLTTFPAVTLEELRSLKSLTFWGCHKLKPLSGRLNRAPPLRRLEMRELPELECLPESMQQLTSLEFLAVSSCDGLLCLPDWLGCLHTLTLQIWGCKKLRCLPDSCKNLISLRNLSITRCPQLETRCKKGEGEDWPKISHIPTINIGWLFLV